MAALWFPLNIPMTHLQPLALWVHKITVSGGSLFRVYIHTSPWLGWNRIVFEDWSTWMPWHKLRDVLSRDTPWKAKFKLSCCRVLYPSSNLTRLWNVFSCHQNQQYLLWIGSQETETMGRGGAANHVKTKDLLLDLIMQFELPTLCHRSDLHYSIVLLQWPSLILGWRHEMSI